MNARKGRRVLMVAFDSAEVTLVERWMEEGILPNLSRLRARGANVRLQSTAELFHASAWPSFVTGASPARHGINNYLMWRPESMSYERVKAADLHSPPFWRRLAAAGRPTIAIDVPYSFPPGVANSVEVHGWGGPYRLVPTYAEPRKLLRSLIRRFGRPAMKGYTTGLFSAREYIRIRDRIVETTHEMGRIALWLMRNHPWELCIFGLGSAHTAGHQLWDSANVRGEIDPQQQEILDRALRDVYVACDEAIGEVLTQAGTDTDVLVFAMHGMRVNNSFNPLIGPMLGRILSDGSDGGRTAPERTGSRALDRLREAVPPEWRGAVKGRLPSSLQDRLTIFWRRSLRPEWRRTRAFPMLADADGYVRVNLAGREAEGIVAPGSEYEDVCDRICSGLSSFVEMETGRPLASRVCRASELLPAASARVLSRFPDVTVQWSDIPVASVRAVTSPDFGEIRWPAPGRVVDGQSGNHRSEGWLIAAGPRISPGMDLGRAHNLDLVPTVFTLLGVTPPEGIEGEPLVGAPGPS